MVKLGDRPLGIFLGPKLNGGHSSASSSTSDYIGTNHIIVCEEIPNILGCRFKWHVTYEYRVLIIAITYIRGTVQLTPGKVPVASATSTSEPFSASTTISTTTTVAATLITSSWRS